MSRRLFGGALLTRMSLLDALVDAGARWLGAVRLFTRHGIGIATRQIFHDRVVRPSLLPAVIPENRNRIKECRQIIDSAFTTGRYEKKWFMRIQLNPS